MGSSKSKIDTPKNPLQELQLKEILREQKIKKKEKQQKALRKIQEKNIKKQQKHVKSTNNDRVEVTQSSQNYDLNQQEYELKIEQSLKNQLDNDLCAFILNQMTLTLQFFGNFEREISAAYEHLWKQMENNLNQQFDEHSVLMANALDAAVQRRVRYKPMHGSEKHSHKPLQPQTMYVVFENIDIARPNEANYDSLSPICKVDMETDFYKTTPCSADYASVLKNTKWKGYVRLMLRNSQIQTRNSVIQPKTLINDEGFYFTSESTISSSSRRRDGFRYSTSSGYNSGAEYDYAYITHLNSHHPLTELAMTNLQVDTKILPEPCIANFHDFIEMPDDEDEEEEDDEQIEEGYDFDEDFHLKHFSKFNFPSVKYLNSREFMRYFAELLRRKLAPKLGLGADEFENGTYRGASIHTKNYEIIPAIHVAHNAQNWPDCAFQFKRRERPLKMNPLTKKKFQWPTPEMIKRVETFGFHVIPLGHAPKRQRNPYREIEWKIIFPKAERFLETTLTNTQIKVFMITKALIKAFVANQQENDSTLMFTMDYLRTHLFWECEKNYVTWPEEFLGGVLIRFIKAFMIRLREKCLPDFFIQERNLFESIPEYSLVRLHSVLAEIVSNPVMHLMIALRNLYFIDDFIPKMDYKKLYNNLVENNYLKLKNFSKNSKIIPMLEDMKANLSGAKEESIDVHGLIGYAQHKDKIKGPMRKRTLLMKQSIEMRRRKEFEKNRKSVDSIDLEFVFTKNLKELEKKDYNQGIENLRRTNILEIIIDSLINLGETYIKTKEYRSIHLARIYLNQAKRLCKFYSGYGCDMGAIEYISKIETIESQIAIIFSTESNILPPALPIRTSLEPISSFRPLCMDSPKIKESQSGSYSRQSSVVLLDSPKQGRERKHSIKFSNSIEDKSSIQHVKADVHSGNGNFNSHREPRRSIKFSDEAPSPTFIFQFDDSDWLQRQTSTESEKLKKRSSEVRVHKPSLRPRQSKKKPRYPSTSSETDSDCEGTKYHWSLSQNTPATTFASKSKDKSLISSTDSKLKKPQQGLKSKMPSFKGGSQPIKSDAMLNSKLNDANFMPSSPTSILQLKERNSPKSTSRLSAFSMDSLAAFEQSRSQLSVKKSEGIILLNGVKDTEISEL